ncbi:uncharacterized protein [Macrobrachium rosenbergii]|uniref:uncharacterized protein isoform X1 n=1 Tax=Macrobrachium rosenbergii TaxID=79674 RepID=UPI0034D5D5AD
MVRAGLGASSSSFRTYVFLPFQGRNQGGWLQALFVFHFFWIVGRLAPSLEDATRNPEYGRIRTFSLLAVQLKYVQVCKIRLNNGREGNDRTNFSTFAISNSEEYGNVTPSDG